MIEKIEFLSARAIPCQESMRLGDWELRFAGDLTRRTNSVNVMAAGEKKIDLADRIHGCEKIYRDRGQPCHFRVTPWGIDLGLDRALAERGYEKFDVTDIRLLDLTGRDFSADPKIIMSARESDAWLGDIALLTGQPPQAKAAFGEMMARIEGHKICAHIQKNRRASACALGVAEQNMIGIFEVATAKNARRHGIGKCMISSILNAAKKAGAETAYLQVVHENRPGNRFWDSMGFSAPLYSYHYRSISD